MSDPANKTIYRNVMLALMAGTIITVFVAFNVHAGRPGNITIGILIAVIKASLVVLFFMHLKYEKRWWLGLVIFPVALVMIILFSNFPDTGLNGDEFVSPAVEKIEHRGHAGPAH